MTYFQHYYTSAKSGFGGVSGFQTYSASEGLVEQDIEEIEKYSKYNRPDNMPAQPENESMANYPKAFTFLKLPSGRFGLAFTQYTGKDYSGRFGNSFSHTIVSDEDYFPFYPFQLYQSSIYRNRLTEEEENISSRPEPLPTLEKVTIASDLSFDNIHAFLKEENRIVVLKKMINIILNYEEHGKRILIVDEKEHVPMWLAAIQMAFPVRLAHHLTFTSYTYDPLQSNAFINATLQEGTSYRNNESMLNHQFHVFDVHFNRYSQVEKMYLYTEFVTSQMLENWNGLQPFFTFLEKTNYQKVNEEIDGAVSLFKFMNGMSINKEELRSAISFADTYCNQSLQQQIVETLRDNFYFDIEKWQNLIDGLDLGLAKSMSRFLFNTVYIARNQENSRFAFKFFFDSFNKLMLKADHAMLSETIAYFHHIKAMNHQNGEFQKWALGSNLNDVFLPLSKESHEEKIKFYVSNVFQHLAELNAGVEHIQKEHSQFVLPLLDKMFTSQSRDHYVQMLLKEYPSYTERFLVYLSKKYSNEVDSILLDAIEKNSYKPGAIFTTKEGLLILKRVAEKALEESRSPATTLLNWYSSILKPASIPTKTIAELVCTVIEKIEIIGERDRLFEQAEKLLNSELIDYPSKQYLGRFIISIERSIPLDDRYKQHIHLLTSMKKVKDNVTITNNANIFNLIEFAEGLKVKQNEIQIKLITRDLKHLSSSKYQEYMVWILPLLAKRNEISASIIQSLAPLNLVEDLWMAIERLLEDKKVDKKQAPILIESFFTYYLHIIKHTIDDGNEPIYHESIIVYLKDNKSVVKHLNEQFLKKKKYQKEWDLLKDKIVEDRNLLSKVKNILSFKK
ncbi:hypothetical protein FS935_08410 [Metabacillus litoralis]|uniref:Uncharacterized protein n=1 Tax=Metabacillus litoralis TaxID=152268 RepID=A0A5C6W1W6_9BACI|nr:hypothetical protein [Metabacillus litoralis]TXC90920.1 hypothetical protein FS935_08410 [Metabacillus litoralis]